MVSLGINEANLPGLKQDAGNPVPNSNQEQVELFLSCRKLKNMDVFSLTDPQIRVYAGVNGSEKLIGTTEQINDNLNPDFAKTFVMDYKFETKQPLHFEVIDIDGPNKWELVGHVYTTLGEIVGSKNQTAMLNIMNKDKTTGKLIVRSERVHGTQSTAYFEIHAKKLRNKNGWFSTSSPYFKFTRMTGDSGKVVVHESEVITKDLNPQWKPFTISIQTLCNGDPNRPINLEVYSRKGFTEKLIGSCTFTVDEIMNQEKREFVLSKQGKKYKSGIIQIKNFNMIRKPTFLEYVRGVKARRDLVQFGPFKNFSGNKESLAEEVLKEVPNQLMEYMDSMKIAPGAREEVDINRILMSKQSTYLDDNTEPVKPGSAIYDGNKRIEQKVRNGVTYTGTIGEFR